MHSPEVSCFLSCSFKPEDSDLNNLILTICNSLDIKCKNVDGGFSEVPSEVARQQIEDSQIVIVIAVKRDKINDTSWQMPPAVHDEISMAYALKKDILVLKEKEVSVTGFLSSYCTFYEFDRALICQNATLEKIISSIHKIKIKAVKSHDLIPRQDATGFFAESVNFLAELLVENGEYIWKYNSSRTLKFSDKFSGKLKNAAWTAAKPDNPQHKITWDAALLDSSRKFTMTTEVEKDEPECLEVAVILDPKPKENDTATVSFEYKSKYLNPIKKEDIPANFTNRVGSKTFDCLDGFLPIQRTKNFKGQFRFPREYKLRPEDIYTFVASYSSGVDYIVESEMDRMKVNIEDFGGVLIVTISTQSPLEGHVYGLAWNIPI
ncbi:MAG: hypothetical protein PHY09_02135 [Desulfuromonadaceae bacterium]|nr:hypothetical protein [Desulfuromonadaceae bacterium]MDD5105601.1 hypothetical protein [Desulfuromonadaceae bacterium]